jgi:hypothetical protein
MRRVTPSADPPCRLKPASRLPYELLPDRFRPRADGVLRPAVKCRKFGLFVIAITPLGGNGT